MRAVALAACLAVVLGIAGGARSATLTVTTTADSGPGSLRQAILDANGAGGADEIDIPAGTYAPVSPLPDVTDDLSLVGAGSATTIIQGGLNVTGGSSFTLEDVTVENAPADGVAIAGVTAATLQDVTLAGNGRHGLDSTVDVAVTASLITNNVSDGVLSFGTLGLAHSTVTGNGGVAVDVRGPAATLTDDTIGGAPLKNSVVAQGSISIVSSTIDSSGNDGVRTNGPLAMSNDTVSNSQNVGVNASADTTIDGTTVTGTVGSYAIWSQGGALSIANSTVTANSGGGVEAEGSAVTLLNDTIANNAGGDGGFGDFTTATVDNTIVVGNSGRDCAARVAATAGSLDGDGTCGFALTGDPHLGPLQDNGGPTFTRAPAAGSIAVDGGDDASCSSVDQRGTPRPQGAHCDIGSVEVTAPPGSVSASRSTVAADPTAGATTSTITVTLEDSGGNPVSGDQVALSSSGGGNSVISTPSGVSDAHGVVTFAVSDTTSETVTYTARDVTAGVTIAQTVSVSFRAITSASRSTVVASPENGTTTSTISVTLEDAAGNSVSGDQVALTASGGSPTISAPSGPSDAHGAVTFTVSDSTSETVAFEARDTTAGVSLAQTASVAFGVPTAPAGNSTPAAPPAPPTANFTFSRQWPATGVPYQFVATPSPGAVSYTWDFGDGFTGTGETVSHTYALVGQPTVTLTVEDALGRVATAQQAVGVPQELVSAWVGPGTAPADGSSTAAIHIIDRKAVCGTDSYLTDSVAIAQDGHSSIWGYSGPQAPDRFGFLNVNVSDTVAETVTYDVHVTLAKPGAPCNGPAFQSDLQVQLTFSPAALVPGAAISLSQTRLPADDVHTSTATVTWPVPGSNGHVKRNVKLVARIASGPGAGSLAHTVITPEKVLTTVGGIARFTIRDATPERIAVTAVDADNGGTLASNDTILFTPALKPSAAHTIVFASPGQAPSGPPGGALVTVRLRNIFGGVVAGKVVALAASPSGIARIAPPHAVTDVNGQATFFVTDLAGQHVVFTPRDTTDGIQLHATAVTFVAHTLSLAASAVTAPEGAGLADGFAPSAIAVRVTDAVGRGFAGEPVHVHVASGAARLTIADGVTDATGTATFFATDAIAERATFAATIGTPPLALALTQTAAVDFKTPAPDPSQSSFAVDVRSARAHPVLVLTIRDAAGIPISNVFARVYKKDGWQSTGVCATTISLGVVAPCALASTDTASAVTDAAGRAYWLESVDPAGVGAVEWCGELPGYEQAGILTGPIGCGWVSR